MEKAALTIYMIVLVLSPLLFGAVHTYAYTIMILGVLTGSLLLIRRNIRKNPRTGIYNLHWPSTTLRFAFMVLLVFLFAQIIPLPPSVVRFLSPEALVVGEKSLPLSEVLTSQSVSEGWFALSPYAYPVRQSIVRWTVYGLFFLGLSQILNTRKRIEQVALLIVITGCFEALYGLIQTYSGYGHIWWYKKQVGIPDVTGTYINRNHFAGLMEICLMLAACLPAALSSRRQRKSGFTGLKITLRARISRFLSGEQRFNKRTFLLFCGVVIGIGLIFSASRGGILGGATGLLCMGLLFVFRKGHRRKGLVILALFLITACYALRIGAEYPASRFAYFDISMKDRARLTQKAMEIFEEYPATGIGVGNLQYAYPKFQSLEDRRLFVLHAHNDWVQFLAEGGIVGFALMLAAWLYYLYRTLRLWIKRKDPFVLSLALAPLAAMAAMVIHSYVDYGLHFPGTALTLVAVMAIGYASLHLERHHNRDKSFYPSRIIPMKYRGLVMLLFSLGLIAWCGSWTVRHFVAEAFCNTVTNSTFNRDRNPPLKEVEKAIRWDGWNGEYWFKRARALMKIRDAAWKTWNPEEGSRQLDAIHKYQRDIIGSLESAIRLNPFPAEYHVRLGWEYAYLWHDPHYRNRWLPAADAVMDRAAYFAGTANPIVHLDMANYWVMRSKTLTPANPEWESTWSKACWHYKKAQEIEGRDRMLKTVIQHIWRSYPDKAFVRDAVHERSFEKARKILENFK